jgi:phosphoglycerate dehydrogenase-like enzyme
MKVLLTGAFRYHPDQIEALQQLGCEVLFLQQETESLPIAAGEIEATVCNGLFLSHSIDSFTNLKYIQLTSAGFDRVPLEEIKRRGITINNARGVYSIPMAEWALTRILEHFKHLSFFNDNQKNAVWEKERRLRELNGSRSAIVGAGNIGQEVAKRLTAFGVSVVGYDVFLGDRPYFDSVHHVDALLSEVSEYDIIVLTAPLTDETRHMISSVILKAMKQDAILVNIARGGLIDTDALIEVLNLRTDLFAALDVFEEEPLPAESPLWKLPNVALSPHNSFVSSGNNERMFNVIYNNLKAYLAQ